ncbi:MAG: FMN-binding protein [Thermotogota bacterium]
MTKKRKKILMIVLLVVAVVVIIGGFVIKNLIDKLDDGLEDLMALEIENVVISEVPDGTYSGAYKQFPIDVALTVSVKNGEIQDIRINKHVNGKGKDGEKITDKVISQQSLDVDTISGATYSGIVILKAVEQALLNR